MIDRCAYCNMLMQHITVLKNELTKSEQATLYELKSYYWLIEKYCNEVLIDCDCEYRDEFRNILTVLLELFRTNEIVIKTENMQCDVCKVLPCEIFSLLDLACKKSNKNDIESMCAELLYHIFLAWIYDELIGRCTKCDAYVEYIACLENACRFLENKNLNELRDFVYYWKIARNSDEIFGCTDDLIVDSDIKSTEINVDDNTTIYLDFNVYNRYEKEKIVEEFFDKLVKQEGMVVVCSGTHLEEVLRMDNEAYEEKRICSIKKLTHGKISLVGDNGEIIVCVENINSRFEHVKKYEKLNTFAEERECIKAEARELLALHIQNEQRDKAIGASSIREMMENGKDLSCSKKKNLPDEDELNRILSYVGIGGYGIREYKEMLKGEGKKFKQINAAIVSIAELLNVLGLHGDKVRKKEDSSAVYPIYHRNSYRTIRSGYYDNDHLSFASKCTYFVTTDFTLYQKAKEIYEFLGIGTIPVLLDDFIDKLSEK